MPESASKNIDKPAKGTSRMRKQAAPVFPEFPVRAAAPPTTAGEDAPLADFPTPNWEMWRTRGACRVWKAVLISMAIKPTLEVSRRLKQEQPHRYAEYLRRKRDVVAQFGLHPDLQAVPHPNAGEKAIDQYIMLRSLLSFAQQYHWDDLDAFDQGTRMASPKAVAASRAHSSFEALPQGQRHALVRTGALLQLLEEVLRKGVEMNAASLLRGGDLNVSEVASRIEKIIGNAADQEKVANFEAEANRKQFGEARQALRAYL